MAKKKIINPNVNLTIIGDEICEVLTKFKHDFERPAVDKIVMRWYKNKEQLIDILSKHPKWSWSDMAIVDEHATTRTINREEFYTVLMQIKTITNNKRITGEITELMYSDVAWVIDRIYNFLSTEAYISQFDIDRLNGMLALNPDYVPSKITAGMKLSRVIGNWFNAIRLQNIIGSEEYNKLYGRIADIVSPISIVRHTLLSIHPLDYLNMSYGGSSTGKDTWSSCHNLTSGSYMDGCTSYMLDKASMTLFTVDQDYKGTEYRKQRRINRQVFAYDNGILLQSRLYPNSTRESMQNFREYVESLIATALQIENNWTVKNSTRLAFTANRSRHYPDYSYGAGIVATNSNFTEESRLLIGSTGGCFLCGYARISRGRLRCSVCSTEKFHRCCDTLITAENPDCVYNGRHMCQRCYDARVAIYGLPREARGAQ